MIAMDQLIYVTRRDRKQRTLTPWRSSVGSVARSCGVYPQGSKTLYVMASGPPSEHYFLPFSENDVCV